MSGPACCVNPPALSSASGEGHIEEIGGFNCYVSGSLHFKRSIVLISDVFGYEAPKLRKIADKVAAAGFYAVVPDLLYGEPYSIDNADRPFPVWVQDHKPIKGCEDVRKVITDIKSKGVTAVGAAGFCWGGMVVVKLAEFDDIKAGVVLHPGPLVDDDINDVSIPLAILGAEIDQHCPPEQVKRYGEILSAKFPQTFVKIYPGVVHGWTVRYKDDDEFVVKSAMEAHSDMLNFLTEHVK